MVSNEKIKAPAEKSPVITTGLSETPKILVADDDPMICKQAAKILGESFLVEACHRGEDVPIIAAAQRPDLILLDINLGNMSGFDVFKALLRNHATSDIPVVFMTGDQDEESEIRGFREGAADYVRKPIVPEVLLRRAARIITLDHLQNDLRKEVRNQTLRAEHLSYEMMLALSKTVDAKDHYTSGHSERVAIYSAEIGRRMGKNISEQEKLYRMGLLHDIGKIGVPGDIINKTSSLTDPEFERISRHTMLGGEILSMITEMPELAEGARSHHERFDGTGYPDGLKGMEIPEYARIICVADCYDAMTSTRTYSTPLSQDEVRTEFKRNAGTQFDPDIAKIMLEMIDDDIDYSMNEKTTDLHLWKGSEKLWTFEEEAMERLDKSVEDVLNNAVNLKVPDRNDTSHAQHEDKTEKEQKDKLPEWLKEIPEINTEVGLRFCGSTDIYLSTLAIYGEDAYLAADEIERMWDNGELINTTTKVHAIKSLSRTIGAEEIGALAEKLEFAGKAGDFDTLNAELGGLLERIRNTSKALAPFCEPDDR